MKSASFSAEPSASPSSRTVTLTARGTVEVVNWVLGFGEHAVVRAPGSLRDEVAAVTKRMAAAYAVS